MRMAVLAVQGACLAVTGALGCGKTDVSIGPHGHPMAKPAWDDPTPANGFHTVEPKPAKCPPQGYQVTTASGYYTDETAGEPR